MKFDSSEYSKPFIVIVSILGVMFGVLFVLWAWGRGVNVRNWEAILFTIVTIACLILIVDSVVWERKGPRCDICGEHAENQIDVFWLCDLCSSQIAMAARQQLGIAYSLEACGYVETNKDVLAVELEIIRERIGR